MNIKGVKTKKTWTAQLRHCAAIIGCNLGFIMACSLLASCGGDDGQGGDDKKQQTIDEDDDNTTATINDDYTYKLPVIFHVIYSNANDASQYIPSARLQKLLSYVNLMYKGNVFGESEGLNVQFVAANYDENGNKLKTPGVEYVKWSGSYPISPSEFMGDNTGKYVSYLWDPNEYINVMLYNFKSTSDDATMLGISHMPFAIKGSDALAGLSTTISKYIPKRNLKHAHCVSINSLYANTDGSGDYYESDRYANANHEATYISPMDVVVTLSHELGHYLGLFHTFSEQTSDTQYGYTMTRAADDCQDTDYCDDTPSYNREEYLEYIQYYLRNHPTPYLDDVLTRKPCEGSDFLSDNVMDYSYTLGYKFTKQQKDRMRWVLYYSPMIPGPKKNGATTRAAEGTADGKMSLKPIIAE